MNGSTVQSQLPPGKSLFTHPQELIPAVSEACLPAEVGAHCLANTNKRGIVCWEPVERLCQPFSRGSDGGVAPCAWAVLPVPAPGCAGAAVGHGLGPGGNASTKATLRWETGLLGQMFPKGGVLSAEAGGLVCWKHAGRSRGVPLEGGSRGEHPTAATKAEEAEVLHQQHSLIASAGAGEKQLSAGDGGQGCSKSCPSTTAGPHLSASPAPQRAPLM